MDTKSLLIGIVSFMAGGLLVSTAAVTFDKPSGQPAQGVHGGPAQPAGGHDSMQAMVADLRGKRGDDFDRAFITSMVEHHESAVAMARLAAERAKHQEIKDLSNDIIQSQTKEILDLRQWEVQWGYVADAEASAD